MTEDASATPEDLVGQPDPTLPTIYSNAVRLNGGAYDVALDFGQRVGNLDPEWISRVYMSWTHVAALNRLLETLVKTYEERTGQPLPDAEAALAVEVEPE